MKQVFGADVMRRVEHDCEGTRRLEARVQRPTTDGAGILAGQDIVCLTHEPWHAPWKTSQQIMSVLAAANRVLYVGPPTSLREAIGAGASRGPVLERVGASLFVYHEPRLLARASRDRILGRGFNMFSLPLRLAHARWLARRLGFDAPILCVFDPLLVGAVGTFAEKLVIYYVMDNYTEYINPAAVAQRRAMAQGEARMLKRADLVVAVSERLQQRCLQHNPHSFWVPNGVNYDLFQAHVKEPETPPDMARIKHPIIGYVGVIQEDIDFSLLERMAIEHPEWSLVFVGPEELGPERPKFESLLRHGSVYYLGPKPVQRVPAYVAMCDVGIMPNLPTQSTVPDCDSIKLYEYLACGRPVVSTDTASVRRFSGLVRIANNTADFIAEVEHALVEAPNLSAMRMAAARENSWDRRVAMLGQLITSQLARGIPEGPRTAVFDAEGAGH